MFSAYSKTFGILSALTVALALLVTAIQPDRVAVTVLFLAAVSLGIVALGGRAATGHNDRIGRSGGAVAANRAPRNSYAPALSAIGAGTLVLGAALGAIAYAVGAAVVVAALGLWLSDTWREHPTSSPAISRRVSRSFSLPIVMPLAVLGLIAFVAISFSLIFFSFPEDRSWMIAALVATMVFGGAFVLAFLPVKSTRARFLALIALVAAVVATLGVIGLLRGAPEHGEHGESHAETEVSATHG